MASSNKMSLILSLSKDEAAAPAAGGGYGCPKRRGGL